MGKISIQTCGCCNTPIDGYTNIASVKNAKEVPHDGVVILFGYSKGGWGLRKDRFNFSDEVCRDCFNELWEAFNKVQEVYEHLKKNGSPGKQAKEQGLFGRLLNGSSKVG